MVLVYMLTFRVYWWDPCYIMLPYIAAPWILWPWSTLFLSRCELARKYDRFPKKYFASVCERHLLGYVFSRHHVNAVFMNPAWLEKGGSPKKMIRSRRRSPVARFPSAQARLGSGVRLQKSRRAPIRRYFPSQIDHYLNISIPFNIYVYTII